MDDDVDNSVSHLVKSTNTRRVFIKGYRDRLPLLPVLEALEKRSKIMGAISHASHTLPIRATMTGTCASLWLRLQALCFHDLRQRSYANPSMNTTLTVDVSHCHRQLNERINRSRSERLPQGYNVHSRSLFWLPPMYHRSCNVEPYTIYSSRGMVYSKGQVFGQSATILRDSMRTSVQEDRVKTSITARNPRSTTCMVTAFRASCFCTDIPDFCAIR